MIKQDVNIEINKIKIKRVTQDKFLGVLMDEKLTWDAHKAAIAKKISSYCGVLFRARHILNTAALKTLYYSFIQSHLMYCCTVWGSGSKSSINQIFIAQKRAIRTMFFVKLYEKDELTGKYTYGHTKSYFNTSEILVIHNLILMQMLNQMHKVNLSLAPENTLSFFKKTEINTNNLNINVLNATLRRQGIDGNNIILPTEKHNYVYFAIPNSKLKIYKTSIQVLGPIAYNNFTNYINNNIFTTSGGRAIERLYPKTFKNYIKTLLLTEQANGDPDTWNPTNMPLYTFPTTNITLRNR